jgi:hypothetical protein
MAPKEKEPAIRVRPLSAVLPLALLAGCATFSQALGQTCEERVKDSDWEAAHITCHRALLVSPRDISVWRAWVAVLLKEGKAQEAEAQLQAETSRAEKPSALLGLLGDVRL